MQSFAKTYVVVFLGILLAARSHDVNVIDLEFILSTAELALISVLRNVYKLLMENWQENS